MSNSILLNKSKDFASATDVLKTEQYAEDLIKENWRLATEYMHKINGTSSTLG